MGVLGKDLFDLQRPHTNTKVEFGAFGYWVEFVPDLQPYGAVLTEVLNLDVTPFQELLDRLNAAVQEKNYDAAPQAYMDNVIPSDGLLRCNVPLSTLYIFNALAEFVL